MAKETKNQIDELDQARQEIKELDKMIKVASIAESLKGINSKKVNELNEEWKKRYPNNPVTFDEEWVKKFSMGANKYTYNGKGNIWTQYKNDLIQQRKKSEKVVKDHNNAVAKEKVDKWENADYSKQAERKRWNENKAKEAKRNMNYFSDRIALIQKHKDNPKAVFQARKYLGKGKYGPLTWMKRDEYLKHCQTEFNRWTKAAHNYDWGVRDAEAKMSAMGVKPKVKGDSKKGNDAKRRVRNTNQLPEVVVTAARHPAMPKEVQEQAQKLGVEIQTFKDSKGNAVYAFFDARANSNTSGTYIGVMTQKKGQELSPYMNVESKEMTALVQRANLMTVKKENYDNLIDSMHAQYTKDIENKGITTLKEQLNVMTTPKIDKDQKISLNPTVQVVPKIKENGKLSKKNFNIQLMDADGKTFTLTKKMVKEAIKNESIVITSNGQVVDRETRAIETWDNYLKAAKEGKLQPETVASFFKETKPNLGVNYTKSAEKTAGVKIGPDMSMREDITISQPAPVTPETPAVETPAPETPTPETPAVETPAPETPAPTAEVITGGTTIVEETTRDVSATGKSKSITTTPDGVSYSFDERGILSYEGSTGIYSKLSSEYLTPGYEKETGEKRDFKNGQASFYKAYKDKDGKYHCGGTTGTIYNTVVQTEKVALRDIVIKNAVYNDLKRKEAKGPLGDAEKKFMAAHEKSLADRGLIRCPDGVLEYKDCPEKYHDKLAHNKAAALNMSIQRGTAKSVTTTIHTGGGNTNVNTNTAGRGGME